MMMVHVILILYLQLLTLKQLIYNLLEIQKM